MEQTRSSNIFTCLPPPRCAPEQRESPCRRSPRKQSFSFNTPPPQREIGVLNRDHGGGAAEKEERSGAARRECVPNSLVVARQGGCSPQYRRQRFQKKIRGGRLPEGMKKKEGRSRPGEDAGIRRIGVATAPRYSVPRTPAPKHPFPTSEQKEDISRVTSFGRALCNAGRYPIIIKRPTANWQFSLWTKSTGTMSLGTESQKS